MRKKTFLKIVELQTEQARKHLGEVQGIYREMRGYKHDFHHHLQALKGYIETGEFSRALSYIDELDSNLKNVDTSIKTGNISADAILSAKIAQAKEIGTDITIKASIPDHLTLTDVELSIILGNLLDNAVESCLLLPQSKRFIRLYISMKGTMLYFSMLNSSGEKKTKKGKLFTTNKSGFHGFGLGRAESIIEEHGGWCKYNSEDGAFSTEFLVPAKPAK